MNWSPRALHVQLRVAQKSCVRYDRGHEGPFFLDRDDRLDDTASTRVAPAANLRDHLVEPTMISLLPAATLRHNFRTGSAGERAWQVRWHRSQWRR